MNDTGNIAVSFLDHRRAAQCPPDPAYPKGKDVVLGNALTLGGQCLACKAAQPFGRLRCTECGRPLVFPVDRATCTIELPWPAPRCGVWLLKCMTCGLSVALTAAGRPDDPRSVKLPCEAPRALNEGRPSA